MAVMIMRIAPGALLLGILATGASAAPEAANAPDAPAPPTLDAGIAEVALYAFCPRPVSLCSAGLSVGIQRKSLVFVSAPGLGITADGAARFGFGWGVETERDGADDEQAMIGHVLFDLHVGAGPGLRLGPLDLMTAAGLGTGAWAYARTGRSDSEGEIFWYATAAARVRLGAAFAIEVSGERKYPSRALGDAYEQRIDAGALWLADGGKYMLSAFYADYDTIAMAGLLLGKALW